jgi:hypothetical protein
MRAQFADKAFQSGHVGVRNALGAIMQVLMRSDIPAAKAFPSRPFVRLTD